MKKIVVGLGFAAGLLMASPVIAAGQSEQTAASGTAMQHGQHARDGAGPVDGRPAWNGGSGSRPAGGNAKAWTNQPIISPVMRRGARDRMSAGLVAKNLEPEAFEVFAPDSSVAGARRTVAVDPEATAIKALPRLGNYYWITARQEKDDQVTVASTAHYFGEPGPAPTRLLLEQKHELEIIPQPLPREHGAWRESEKWSFMLRFNGQPLANTALRMETEFGSKTGFVSDARGRVTVLFPRDFKPDEKQPGQGAHSHGPRRARFVLAAEHDDGGKHYLTAFNFTYSADPDRSRDLFAGVGFGVFGMLLAMPLLRRRKPDSNKNTREA